MKSTGIVRKVDNLGRFVLPIELRRMFEIAPDDNLEIFIDKNIIILKKYSHPWLPVPAAAGSAFWGSRP